MFGWIKNRIKKDDDDYSDLRSGILNEPEPAFRRQPVDERNYDDFSQRTRDVFEPMQMQQPLPEAAPEFSQQPGRNYEIMDRLNLIESQLAAVRSMTETINERLKNMESRLGMQRRY